MEASGETLGALMADLDHQFPGMRFRMIDEQNGIRPHIKLFVNQEQVTGLDGPLAGDEEIHIICALSGGTLGRQATRQLQAPITRLTGCEVSDELSR